MKVNIKQSAGNCSSVTLKVSQIGKLTAFVARRSNAILPRCLETYLTSHVSMEKSKTTNGNFKRKLKENGEDYT